MCYGFSPNNSNAKFLHNHYRRNRETKGNTSKLKHNSHAPTVQSPQCEPAVLHDTITIHSPPLSPLAPPSTTTHSLKHTDCEPLLLNCSTPVNKSFKSTHNDEMYEELLQGLCEEDLSVSCNHSAMSLSINNTKLDSLLDEALFADVSDSLNEQDMDNKTSNKCIYPLESFYGLPLKVLDCLKEYRGISKLYGMYTVY